MDDINHVHGGHDGIEPTRMSERGRTRGRVKKKIT